MKNSSSSLYLICTLIIVIMSALGCGGGGGGSGRQTLPGENPFGPSITNPSGTGTGTGTGTATTPGTNTGTGTDAEQQTPPQLINSGYSKLSEGNYQTAITAFTLVIYNNNASPAQKQEARNGRGWAKARTNSDQGGGTVAAIDDLKTASNMNLGSSADPIVTNESKLGYAISLVYLVVGGSDAPNNSANLGIAINILNELLAQMPWVGKVIRSEYQGLYVSAAEARAMLALAYDLNGQAALADTHINQALAEEPNNPNIQNAKQTIAMLRGNL